MILPQFEKFRALLTLALPTVLLNVLAPTPAQAAPPTGYTLVWADEFSGSTVDTNYWNILTGPYSDATRTADAITVGGGALTITTYTTSGVHYTGFLSTRDKYQAKYGYIEARMESIVSSGVNHAFWLQAPTNGSMIGDPWNAGTEMDIVEHRHTTSTGYHADQATSAVHWDGYTSANHKERGSGMQGANLETGFHTYAVEWTPDHMKYYYDGALVWTLTNTTNANETDTSKAPVSQRSEFIYLTAAVKSGAFAGTIPTGGYGSQSASTTKMKVDYVRVYQLNPAAPAVPEQFTVGSGNGQAELRWTLSANAATHKIKRATTRGGPYSTIASGVTGNAYVDTGLTNGLTYYYVVSAVSSSGESANSPEASATPMLSHTTVVVDNADASGVTIVGSWTTGTAGTGFQGSNYLHDGNTGATGGKSVQLTPNLATTTDYDVYLNWTGSSNRAVRVPVDIVHAGGTTTVMVDQTHNGSTWYQLGTFGFTAGTAGSVKVRNDLDGASGYVVADAARFVQLPLPPPTGLEAAAASSTQIDLAWTAARGATSYTVKRATTSGGTYTTIASGVTATSYSDAGRSANTTYYYVVAAVNTGGASVNSAEVSALTAPAVPTGVVATSGDGRIVLSWNASAGATNYNVKRAWVSGGPYTTIGTPGVNSYINTGLTNGTPFYYRIAAVNSGGESGNSSEVTATPQAITIIKDNSDGSGIALTGAWTTGTATAGYYGTNYLHDGDSATGGKKVTFTPSVVTAGTYQVYARWTAHSNRASSVPIDITHAGGTSTVTVNQQINNGTWVLLGEYSFTSGMTGNIAVRNDGASGYVIADAVRLVLK